jgi:transmembrane sensor
MDRESDSSASISEQAAQWWAQLHTEDTSANDHREFGKWVAKSPDRIEAYLEIVGLMRALKSRSVRWPGTPVDVLIRAAKGSPSEPVALFSSEVADGTDRSLAEQEPAPRVAQSTSARATNQTRPTGAWLAAAAIVLAVLATSWFVLTSPQHYQTKFGEQRSILLDDGSRVTLNTGSKIEIDLGSKRRIVRLLAGEALFDVAHDSTRPFDVFAGKTVLRAVGTEFNVDMRPSQTTVTVLEGRVAVVQTSEAAALGSVEPAAPHQGGTIEPTLGKESPRDFPAPRGALMIGAAERIVITSAGTSRPQHVANLAATTSWTERRLVFERRPLSEVADEFNRYSRERIIIESPQLRNQEVTGVVQSDDPASFLSFLSGVPGVEVHEGADGTRIVTFHGPAGDSATVR